MQWMHEASPLRVGVWCGLFGGGRLGGLTDEACKRANLTAGSAAERAALGHVEAAGRTHRAKGDLRERCLRGQAQQNRCNMGVEG